MAAVQALNTTIWNWYPAFDPDAAFGTGAVSMDAVPALGSRVRIFDSEADLVSYVKSADYGRDVLDPSVHAAIVINSPGPHWDYSIRTFAAADGAHCKRCRGG